MTVDSVFKDNPKLIEKFLVRDIPTTTIFDHSIENLFDLLKDADVRNNNLEIELKKARVTIDRQGTELGELRKLKIRQG
mgnify:CR=1 FL=1